MGDSSVNLPPGFRFHPTDEELVVHFLYPKASLLPSHPDLIPDLHPYPYDPWELNGKALSSGNQSYFFSRMTENRETKNGYWKQLDIDEAIYTSGTKKVGIKKCLVFYMGEAPAGIETNWVMHEYRLCNRGSTIINTSYKRRGNQKLDSSRWILCRVHERKGDSERGFCYNDGDDDEDDDGTELSCLDEMFLSLDDDLDEISLPS